MLKDLNGLLSHLDSNLSAVFLDLYDLVSDCDLGRRHLAQEPFHNRPHDYAREDRGEDADRCHKALLALLA